MNSITQKILLILIDRQILLKRFIETPCRSEEASMVIKYFIVQKYRNKYAEQAYKNSISRKTRTQMKILLSVEMVTYM